MEAPSVQINQWVQVGPSGIDAVVLDIYTDGSLAVGYYQNRLKAIKEDVVWNGAQWQFKHSGPSGSYLGGAEAAMVKRGPSRGSGI